MPSLLGPCPVPAARRLPHTTRKSGGADRCAPRHNSERADFAFANQMGKQLGRQAERFGKSRLQWFAVEETATTDGVPVRDDEPSSINLEEEGAGR